MRIVEFARMAKRGRGPFAGTARRVLRTKGSRPLFAIRRCRFDDRRRVCRSTDRSGHCIRGHSLEACTNHQRLTCRSNRSAQLAADRRSRAGSCRYNHLIVDGAANSGGRMNTTFIGFVMDFQDALDKLDSRSVEAAGSSCERNWWRRKPACLLMIQRAMT